MKCSAGVAICAAVILLGSVLTLAGAAGALFMFLGPMSGQLFDPASLPPGADVRTMRAFGIGGAVMMTLVGAVGVATGVGLIRLWRWARYATIVFGAVVILFSVLSAATILLMPMPAPSSGVAAGRALPAAFRMAMAGFYGFCGLVGGWFVYFFLRAKTVAQFAAGSVAAGPRVRPLSITVIAWLMIVSGAMMAPALVFINLPAVFLGLVLTGIAARTFYALYVVAYLAIGIGLIQRTPSALTPAIVLHAFAVLNALVMLVPSAWSRYQEALTSMSPMLANQPPMAGIHYFSVGSGIVVAGVILYFLMTARWTMTVTHVDA